jgi:hypothetical protein
LAECPFIF